MVGNKGCVVLRSTGDILSITLPLRLLDHRNSGEKESDMLDYFQITAFAGHSRSVSQRNFQWLWHNGQDMYKLKPDRIPAKKRRGRDNIWLTVEILSIESCWKRETWCVAPPTPKWAENSRAGHSQEQLGNTNWTWWEKKIREIKVWQLRR